MPLEAGIDKDSTPSDLDKLWPLSNDPKSEGDDHLRNIKQVLQNFYTKLKVGNFPAGTIPAMFGEFGDESGLVVREGGLRAITPMIVESLFTHDGVNGNDAPVPYSPLGSDAPLTHYRTAAVTDVDTQPLDTEVAGAPIAFEYVPPEDFFSTSLTFRGNALVTNVRITVKETDVNGEVIFRSATDEELRNGGGFTLNATGDTVVNLPQLWQKIAIRTEFVTLERYDSITDTIIATGIPLKGVTILGDFVPYVVLRGYPYTLVELQEKIGAPIGTRIHTEQVDGPLAIGAATEIHNFNLTGIAGTYEWELTVVANFIITNDGFADIEVSIGGVAQSVAGHTSVGQLASRSIGRVRSYHFRGEYIKADALDKVFLVNGVIGNGTISVAQSRIIVNQIG